MGNALKLKGRDMNRDIKTKTDYSTASGEMWGKRIRNKKGI